MKLTLLAISTFTLLAGLVSAQSLQVLPACAQNCTLNAIPASCNGQPECICSSSSFIDSISCCVYKACNATDQQQALLYAQGICAPAGVTNLPTTAGCTGAAATGANATAGSSGSSASVTSAVSSASAALTSGTSTVTSATNTVTSATSAVTSASSAATSTAGAGSDKFVAQGMGAIGVALMGVAALL